MLTRKVPAEVVFLKPLIIFMKCYEIYFFKNEKVLTYASCIFVSKGSIVGFLSYRPLKMILVMIFIDR